MSTSLRPPVPYESRLNSDLRWALSEGSRFFEGRSAVHSALRKITQRLDQLGVPYAVAGGMALFVHGVRRFTEDVDILVSSQGLKTIHEQLEGRGYIHPFPKSKNLRETENGVRIEFLIQGQFPGDGKPKAVSFPDPSSSAIDRDGVRYLNLQTLIELKLASGMTSPDRMKDLSDVQALIKTLALSEDFANSLNEFVRAKFRELWQGLRTASKRYVRLWRNTFLAADANSLDGIIQSLRSAAEELEQMRAAGVRLDPAGGTKDDYVMLFTDDPDVARRFDMEEESEYWGLEADDAGGI